MAFVLDASVAAAWAFQEETHPDASAALSRLQDEIAHVPTLFWYEIRNVLLVNERRGRITPANTERFLGELAILPIVVDPAPNESTVLALARRHGLTVYDAAYLELAQRLAVPLATLDRALIQAATQVKVPLLTA